MSSSEGNSYSSTPMTSACLTPQLVPASLSSPTISATLRYGCLEFSFEVSAKSHVRATQVIRQFLVSLPTPEPNLSLSLLDLVARFLSFVSEDRIDQHICDLEVLRSAVTQFDRIFLSNNDVHSLAATLNGSREEKLEVIRSYYRARVLANPLNDSSFTPALLRAVENGAATIYTIFGGQGNTRTFLDEIREVYITYMPLVAEFVARSAELLLSLSRGSRARKALCGNAELDVLTWLRAPARTPDSAFLISSPVSFPLIGFLQLMHYVVICKVLDKSPREMRDYVRGTTGHSQGIIAAVVTAAADSWESFDTLAESALTILFWIGLRCQQVYPQASLAPAIIQDSEDNGEGVPTPVLSIRDLPQKQILEHIDATNKHLPAEEQVVISLINNARNIVVTGPPLSLYGLNVRLRQIKAPASLDQSRVPFTQRKVTFTSSFLPITAPFHSHYLASATQLALGDLQGIEVLGESLGIPVYSTRTGEDIARTSGNLVPTLVRMITEDPVDWVKATAFPNATHIVDFGPGGISGLGVLTHRNKEGTGVRIILADRIEGPNLEVGYKPEIFDRDCRSVKYSTNWGEDFGPRLVNSAGRTYVDTKLSKLLGVPPIIVGGMTPSTVPWDFVAATMTAGYHIELAGGGYHNSEDMTEALSKLKNVIPPGRGITVNLIYANPQAMAWQIPLLGQLRAKGVPIDGLTIGAGVPSPEIAQGYINMGLRHISFKPGSVSAIEATLNIARANPEFPVILQWTGGRAGGHHSFEDFHQPMLSMYSKIRRCSNVVLVAGSGFGGSKDTYPYLTGTWSARYGYPRMPFDGCLFGSRLMVAKEAHTSHDTKMAIAGTPGIQDEQWEQTYRGPAGAGGVITVISEMGEPIHMLATRGVKFWAEMDRMIFSLPNNQRMGVLERNRKHIIQKLNDDFQKVWFGRNSLGDTVELDQMTYGEVLNRLVELLYIQRRRGMEWIHKSYEKLTGDFMRRVEERFTAAKRVPVISDLCDLGDPRVATEKILNAYPQARDQLVIAQDLQFFLSLCRRQNQKPVPFVPVLDDNFQVYFKKDSLWQSEDLEAVVGQDVGRTCILHGPVAAKYSTAEEPVEEILNRINHGLIEALTEDVYGGSVDAIPDVGYLGRELAESNAFAMDTDSIIIRQTEDKITYRLSCSAEVKLPSTESWLRLLAGTQCTWRRALLLSDICMCGDKFQPNPIKAILVPANGLVVEVMHASEPTDTWITVKEPSRSSGRYVKLVDIKFCGRNEILVCLTNYHTISGSPVCLPLRFSYHPEIGSTPIREILYRRNDRIKMFYWQTWFGRDEKCNLNVSLTDTFVGSEVTINDESVKNFIHTIGNPGESFLGRLGKETFAPMDFAFIVGWKAIMRPLFAIDGDLLRLVHLSNSFRMIPGAEPLKEGNQLVATARINAVVNQESGKMVEVQGTIYRHGSAVMEITSRFLYRGEYTDFENTFQVKQETPMELHLESATDVAVLRSRQWLKLADPDTELIGQRLTFRLRSEIRFKDRTLFRSIETTGQVLSSLSPKETVEVGTVKYKAGVCHGNPVISYLKRHGIPVEQPVAFKSPIPVGGRENIHRLKAPASNKRYARVSGDFNPIHVSHIFSNYANLPGTIVHGMFISAAVRKLIDNLAADNDFRRVHSYSASFVGMVLPNDEIVVSLQHTGMIKGRKLIKIDARKAGSDELVLVGESEVEQPVSAYVFTGQGSQAKGMGMDLYESSPVARAVWERADKYFTDNYGFAITEIVKNDPKELTVHFGGPQGKLIRRNYLSMVCDSVCADGSIKTSKIFKDISETSSSYTFRSPLGLLSATQFTQPALTLMEIARFQDLTSKGLIQSGSSFAGHSLGEYAALSALGGIMPIEKLVAITFTRGLTMQLGVERDSSGRSAYSMCAVNPSKVSRTRTFDEHSLQHVVSTICAQTGWLLEIVNYNISNLQYICAGEVRALACLTSVLNHFLDRSGKAEFAQLSDTELEDLVRSCAAHTEAQPQPLDYERGPATVPLKQIDVPFHSSFLAGGVATYRRFLQGKIQRAEVDPGKLVGNWIPNITGRPFGITRRDFEHLYDVTKSARVCDILANWEGYQARRREELEIVGVM